MKSKKFIVLRLEFDDLSIISRPKQDRDVDSIFVEARPRRDVGTPRDATETTSLV